jgi:HPt (histidine-containing phosphotransfer) domain-containing protein
MADSSIDIATFRELQEAAGAEFVVELVDTFLADAPTMLDELRSALGAGEADKFRRAAHSLKSNSLTFGALGLGDMARELEHQGLDQAKSANAQGLTPLDALAQEYARVAAALTELRDG